MRNIGDSQDRGDSFNGTLSESLLWLATKLRDVSMAGRIVMGIGRNQEDALRGIDVKNAGKTAINDDMKAMLDSVFSNDEEILSDEPEIEGYGKVIQPKVAGDDYVS
jgi:hypothetical protein